MYSLLPVFIGIYALLTSIFIFLHQNRDTQSVTFSLFCLTTFFWQITWAVLFQITEIKIAEILVRTGYFFIIFLPTFMYHFLVITSEYRSKIEKYSLLLSYAVCLTLAFLLPTSLFVEGVYRHSWGFYPDGGILHPIHVLQTCLVVSRGLWLVLKRYWFSTDLNKRNQLKLILIGLFVYFFAAVDYLGNYGFDFYPPGIIFIFISFNLIAWSIIKYDVMDIQLIINSRLAKVLTAVLVSVSFLFLLVLTQNWSFVFRAALTIFFGVICGLYGYEFSNYLITTAQKKFVKGWYDLDKVISDSVRNLSKSKSIKDAFEISLDCLNQIEITNVKVFMPKVKNDEVLSYYLDDFDNKHELLKSNALIQFLSSPIPPVKASGLSSEVKALVNSNEALGGKYILPIYSSSQLYGVMVIFDRDTGVSISPKDEMIFAAIQSQLDVVIDRIRPYEKIKEEIQTADKKIKALEKDRLRASKISHMSQFIQEYNHEIRTPLNMALGEFELIEFEDLDESTFEEFKSLEIKKLNRIKDIVDTTQSLASDTITEQFIDLDINDVIEESVKLNESSIFKVETGFNTVPRIKGSPDALLVVFNNLLKNSYDAFKTAGVENGIVKITTEYDDGEIIIKIHDNGPGISPDVIDRIFYPFVSTHVTKGRGLGLSTVNRIINDHYGQIAVESKPGKGAKFTIFINTILNMQAND